MADKRSKRDSKKGGIKRIADHPAFKELAALLESGAVDPSRVNEYLRSEDVTGDVLTITQVAALLQVSRQTVYSLINRGELKGKRIGERWRFSKRAIIEWIEGGGE